MCESSPLLDQVPVWIHFSTVLCNNRSETTDKIPKGYNDLLHLSRHTILFLVLLVSDIAMK